MLLIRPEGKPGPGNETLVVSRHGDMYVMGGKFQTRVEHAVPPVKDWPFVSSTDK